MSKLGMVGIAWCFWSGFAFAQQYNPYGQKNAPKIELEGKLQAWQGGMMRITNSAGQPVVFALPQAGKGIRYQVDVDQAMLKRGMYIRIQAPVGPTGQFLEPVNYLTLFTPDASRLGAKTSPAERSLNVPGVYRVADIQPPMPGQMGSPDVRIVGTVMGLEQNVLVLQCGKGPMKIELAENPTIELNSNSLEYARPGDSVTGSATMNPNTNQLVATGVTVKGAKKLTAPTPPQNIAIEGTKLRIKERPNSKLKSAESKEGTESQEKPEMKEGLSLEKAESKESVEGTTKPESDPPSKPESEEKPKADEAPGDA